MRNLDYSTLFDSEISESLRFDNLLDEISKRESGGRPNVIYGGETFDDYSDHPRRKVPIKTGPNKGDYSTAAGEWQFLGSTWDMLRDKLDLKDFSPENQRIAAAQLARDDYKKRTDRNLNEDIESDDVNIQRGILSALNKTWTSLPGGIEEQDSANILSNIFSGPESRVMLAASGDLRPGMIPSR